MFSPFPNSRNVALGCASLVFALLCVGCGGGASHTSITNPTPPPITVTPAPVGGIQPSFFGFQCGTGNNNCPNEAWPNGTVAQPGTLRLWDSGTFWNDIESSVGQYNFATLDGWLDTIAAQNKSNVWATPINVIYTFGFVACVESQSTNGQTPKGCIYPPTDFSNSLAGSQAFNNFVTALVTHCSGAGNCVKDLIKNYEMWNEPNNATFWYDTSSTGELVVYQLVYPAVKIIRDNVPKATIMTMASTVDAQYTAQWLQYENKYPPAAGGTLSDVVAWHQYLNSGTSEVAPDDPANISRLNGMLTAIQAVPGWASKPWEITETGFQAYVPPYNCTFGASDCVGQMVRWQLMVLSLNANGMAWYSWYANIGSDPNFSAAWSFMMKNVLGGTFTSSCSSSDGVTWTCGFKETSGKTAQWVWSTNSSGGSSYAVPSGYSNAVSFNASTPSSPSSSAPVSAGQSINITTMPTLLEQ